MCMFQIIVCAYEQTFVNETLVFLLLLRCHCFHMAEFIEVIGCSAMRLSSGRVRILKLLRRSCSKCGTELTAQALSDFFVCLLVWLVCARISIQLVKLYTKNLLTVFESKKKLHKGAFWKCKSCLFFNNRNKIQKNWGAHYGFNINLSYWQCFCKHKNMLAWKGGHHKWLQYEMFYMFCCVLESQLMLIGKFV